MSTINVQPTVTANGETILSVFTEMGLYTCLLGPDFLMKMNESNVQGSRVFGLGSIHTISANTRTAFVPINKTNDLHIYFYNSQGNDAVKFNGKIPSFMDAKLNVTAADITAKVGNLTDLTNASSFKEGIMKERLGVFNLLGTWCGVTAYWPQGYGTGKFDSCCVSLVDLENLKNRSVDSSLENRSAVFAGTCFAVDPTMENSYSTKAISYIRNGVDGLTDENTMLIKFRGRTGLYEYNMITGDVTPSKSEYTGIMGIWGFNQYFIDGVLYGITSKEYVNTDSNEINCYFFAFNISGKTLTIGSSLAVSDLSRSLIKVGSDLYFNTNTFSYQSTMYAPTYYKINLANCAITSTQLSLTVPSFLGNDWKLGCFDDGSYILHDLKNMNSYRFTDISDIENTISEPYFVCNGQPITFGTTTVFMAASSNGFYYETTQLTDLNKTFSNTTYYGTKYMLLDGDIGPLIAYGQFSKTYEKTEDADFTSSYYITVTAVNTNSESE